MPQGPRQLLAALTYIDDDNAGAVYWYHTDFPIHFIERYRASTSPASRVAPSVVPVAGNVDSADEKASLGGAVQTNATAMATLPLLPPAPSTCRRYTVPCVTLKVTQLVPGEPPVVQLSLLASSERLRRMVPV